MFKQPCPHRPDGKHVISVGLWSGGGKSGVAVKCAACRAELEVSEEFVIRAVLQEYMTGEPAPWMSRDEESEEFIAKLRSGSVEF